MKWCKKGGARGYITTQNVNWHIGLKNSGWILKIPVGFEFESSVPPWLHWMFSPDSPQYLKSACIHDYLLEVKKAKPAFAASQWLEAAYSEQVSLWRAIPAFLAVFFYTVTAKKFRKRYD